MFFAVQPTLSLAKIADTMHAQVMMIAALRRNTAAPKAFHENIETTRSFLCIYIKGPTVTYKLADLVKDYPMLIDNNLKLIYAN